MSLRIRLRREYFESPLLRVAVLAVVAVVFLVGGYVSAARPSAGPPVVEDDVARAVRGTIESVSGDRLVLATEAGVVTIVLSPATRFEALGSAGLADVRPGDTVNVGSVPHAQTLFVVVGVVVIPAPLLGEAP